MPLVSLIFSSAPTMAAAEASSPSSPLHIWMSRAAWKESDHAYSLPDISLI